MGTIFTITDKMRQRTSDAIDAMISQWGKNCDLLYPSVKTDCPNCILDAASNRSTGKYKPGGPRQFTNGTICPVCRGNGRLESTSTETIKLLCKLNPKELRPNQVMPGSLLSPPNTFLRTKGYMTDLPKILKARKIIAEVNIKGYIKLEFDLFGEPVDFYNIVQGRYFVCYWKRTGTT